ncbi:MAG: sigma-70 family RNA polymerase sigma factor, partial [Phycisphaerae bacterium]
MTPLTEQFQANLSDGDLLSAFLQNPQQGAFAVIVRRHGGMVLGVCRSVLRNESDAEDAAQAVFLTLAQRASSLGGHRMLVGWLHRVAWYVASNAARAAAIRHRHEQEAARMKPESGAITEMTEVDVIHAELNRLSDKYRTPLLLHHLEGRTQEETASLLGCTVGAVSVRLTRGRQMLRERLVRRGVADSPVGVAAVLASQASAGVLPAFVTSANQTAVAVLAGKAATTAVSASVATLSKGALKMLFWAKMKLVAGLTTAFLLLGGAGLGTYMAIADGGTAPPTPGQARPMAEATTMAASQPKGW